MKERKKERLIFPGLHSQLSNSRESARKRERDRERERERERERQRQADTGTQALMEQRCFSQHGVGICLTRQLFSAKIKIKIPDLQNIR